MTKLRQYLNERGEGSVRELAQATGLSHSHISRIADGHKGPSLEKALAISKITGIPPQYLLKTTPAKGKKSARARIARKAAR